MKVLSVTPPRSSFLGYTTQEWHDRVAIGTVDCPQHGAESPASARGAYCTTMLECDECQAHLDSLPAGRPPRGSRHVHVEPAATGVYLASLARNGRANIRDGWNGFTFSKY